MSPASGVYGADQVLSVESAAPGAGIHYSFRDASGADGPWIPLRGPLELSAAPGEVRDYRLAVRADAAGDEEGERRDLSYRIDRRVPAAPRILPAPGTYWDTISVRFEPAPGDTVYYAVQGDVVRNPVTWDGRDVLIGQQDTRAEYVVQAYSVSASGNRSRIATGRYVLDTRDPVLDVLSPVPGAFANPQTLAVTFRDLAWVRYSLDGSDPAAGMPYTGPVTVDRQGTVTVKIAGMPRGARRGVIRKEVSFTYAPASGSGLRLDTPSGTYPSGASPSVLSSPGGTLYYTLWEKTPNEADPLATAKIPISARTGGPSPVALRLRALSDAGAWGPEYRFFYFVGQGAPAVPSIARDAAEPLGAGGRAQVIPPEDCLLAVTADGKAPDARQPSETTWVDVAPPAGKPGLDVLVRAVAVDGAGILSPVLERRVSTSPGTVEAPQVSLAAGPVQGTAILRGLTPGGAGKAGGAAPALSLVYSLASDGSEPAAAGPDSPALVGPLVLSVPFGESRTFKARVALLDRAGRVVSFSATASLTVDRTPPGRPKLTPGPGVTLDEPTVINFASSGKVFFSVTTDGSMPADPDLSSSPSNTFVVLPGVDGTVVTYRLKVAALDASGNESEVYGPLVYRVDLTPPVIPPISGITDGGHYASRSISPVIEGEHAWSVRYTATSDGSEPPDPGLQSPELTSANAFTGEDGAVTQWRVKLLAISHNGKRVGEKRSLTFYLDLQPPPVPRLGGLPADGRVARPVTLTAEAVPSDTRVLYSISSDGTEPPDPLVSGAPFPPALTLDAPDGARRDYVIRVAAVDDAGNKSLSDRRYALSVDRRPPADPAVKGAEDGTVSARAVTLTLEGGAPLMVYEMTDDGSIPRVPTASSHQYSGPLLLVGKSGAAVTYRILARAFNDLGMASRAARMFSVTVDRTVPAAPPQPGLLFSDANPGVAYLTWPVAQGGRILYRLLPGSESTAGSESQGGSAPAGETGSDDFLPVTGPVSVSVDPDHGSIIRGTAVLESAAGVRSPLADFSVSAGRRLLPPVFRGARDGAASMQAIQLRCGSPDGEVRYETSTDGSYPPTVTASSGLFPDSLLLDAAEGQTVEVTVAARAFDPRGAAIPSEEVFFHAIVDRTPPDPPAVAGIEDGGHYQDARTVSLLAAEGTIYDTVTPGTDTVLPAETQANRYTSPLVLDAPAGQSATYRIVAFSVDAAGNRSREIRSWTVTVDKKIVYASPDGNDYAEGSRDAPVRTIGRAVQMAQAGSRKTIFAAAGTYPEDARVELSGDLALVGGLDPRTWEPLGLERWSSVSPSDRWKGGNALLAMTAGRVSLTGFELSAGPSAPGSLLSVSGGELSYARGAVTLAAQGDGRGIVQSGGTVTLEDVRMRAGAGGRGSFVAASGGTLEISGSLAEGPTDSADFTALDLRDGAVLELRGSSIDPGTGQRTRGIRAISSTVRISASKVSSGNGVIDAVAVESQESAVTVDNGDLAAAPGGRTPAAVLAGGGALKITRSRISVAGTASALGVNAHGAQVVLLRTTVRGARTPEYLALVRLEESTSLIADSLLVGAAAGESVALQVRGGSTDVLNNTVVGGSGTSLVTAILVQGDVIPRLVNNLLTRTGADLGSAITVLDARTLFRGGAAASPVILSNTFGGWKRIAHVEFGPGSLPLDAADVESLNRADGAPFGGTVSANLSEPSLASFGSGAGDAYRPARGSACLDAGVDLGAAQGPGGTGAILLVGATEVSADLLGNPRPGPLPLAVPGPPRGWDIGAYEFVE